MRITFLQSGGFAGGLRGVRLEAESLAPSDRAELERLVAGCGLEGSCERFSGASRDRRQYDLAIDYGGRVVRLSCDEACLPEEARPLVAFLADRAVPQGPGFDLPAASDAAPGPAGVRADLAGWGRFEGEVVARWEDDGRSMTLVAPFAYVDPRAVRWPAAAGSVIDGASIPRAFWTLIGGPFNGRFRDASVVHDAACEARDRPWRAVHRMFYEACRCGGVGAVQAKTMYYAVFHFGPRWRVERRTTIVAGRPRTEEIVEDDTPPQPSETRAAEIARYFATHEVDESEIPTLEIPADAG